jgi:hypothetical protein
MIKEEYCGSGREGSFGGRRFAAKGPKSSTRSGEDLPKTVTLIAGYAKIY